MKTLRASLAAGTLTIFVPSISSLAPSLREAFYELKINLKCKMSYFEGKVVNHASRERLGWYIQYFR